MKVRERERDHRAHLSRTIVVEPRCHGSRWQIHHPDKAERSNGSTQVFLGMDAQTVISMSVGVMIGAAITWWVSCRSEYAC
jgi:hypothetical protein